MALYPCRTAGQSGPQGGTLFITTISDGGWDIRNDDLTMYLTNYISESSFPLATVYRTNATTLRITPHQDVTIAYALNKSSQGAATYTEEAVAAETTKQYTVGNRSFFKVY